MVRETAGYLTEGIGVPRDPVAGAALLVEAGYGGNADALLQLSALTLTGTAPEGWDIAPDLAVAMAFGGMVGQRQAHIGQKAPSQDVHFFFGTELNRMA